jgi:competence protein ComEA
MTTSKLSQFWTLATLLLLVIIIAGGIFIWSKYNVSRPAEISISNPPRPETPGYIYIGGAVANPGYYPLLVGDTMDALIQAAGGTTSQADSSQLKLLVPTPGEERQPQKININRAEAWLLEALPGISEIRAQAIIDYRRQNGLFHNTNELTKVEGIGTTTYEKIKDLITVAD